MKTSGFTCQEPHCGQRRTFERVNGLLVVDACEGCGDAAYSIEAP